MICNFFFDSILIHYFIVIQSVPFWDNKIWDNKQILYNLNEYRGPQKLFDEGPHAAAGWPPLV